MLTLTAIANGSAPRNLEVFWTGSPPSNDTKYLTLKAVHPDGKQSPIVKLDTASSSLPNPIIAGSADIVSGSPVTVCLAWQKANGEELEGSGLFTIVVK